MVIIQLLVIAISLALDAVSVSVAEGLEVTHARLKQAVRIALFFGLFQAGMPVLGWLIGSEVRNIVANIAPWIASVLLIGIGIFMLKETGESDKEREKKVLSYKTLLLLALATSIDAFIVGITLGLVKLSLVLSVSVIGAVTFILCVPAFLFASYLNQRFGGKLELLGGIALILLGLKTLLTIFI